MSSLLNLRSDMIRFLWSVDTSAILCRICSIDFFCIFFISLLFIILIMTSHLLRSNDELFLKCCFFVAISSLVTFAHDVIFVERHMLFCICNCLLNSWIDVFSFCTFFVMNVFWFTWCFSSELSRRCWISFNAISFHEWSLLFSFFNVDIFISKSIMLVMFFCHYISISTLHLCFLVMNQRCLQSSLNQHCCNSCNSLSFNNLLDSLCLVCSALFQNLWCMRCDCFCIMSIKKHLSSLN